MIKILSKILIILALAGCATNEVKDIDIIKKEEDIKINFLHPKRISKPVFEEINFKVINKNNSQELINNNEIVYIALTTEEYKKLSRNMQEIILLIKEQNDVINYYRENIN